MNSAHTLQHPLCVYCAGPADLLYNSAQKCVMTAVQGADPGAICDVGAVHGNIHIPC